MQRLGPASRRAADAVVELEETGADHEWARGVTDAVLSGRAAHLWTRAVEQLVLVDHLLEHDRLAGATQVQVTERIDPAAAAHAFERFAAHLAAGGTVKRVFRSEEQRAVEPYLPAIALRGAEATTPAGATAVAHHLRLLEITGHLEEGFAPLGYPLRRAEHRALLVEQALTLRATCLQVGAVLGAAHHLRAVLAALPAARRPRIDGLAALETVASAVLGLSDTRAADLARTELADVVERVQAGVPADRQAPELRAVVAALRGLDAGAYVEALAALDTARAEQRDQRRADELARRLEDPMTGVPALAAAWRADPDDPAWATRLERWAEAWAHAGATAWLAARHAPAEAVTGSGAGTGPDGRLADLDVELGRVTGRLASARAWRACLGRVTAEQSRALAGHRAALAAVGRGSGRYAERFRRAAREAVEVARDAVPAWVMPIREVLATVPPEPDRFDVVIVDEASQADLTSLFLLWLAPRVIVVGDDRQCTPAEVAIGSLEPVFARLESELPDVPYYLRSQFTPRSSVFSVFRTTFGPPVRLRDHFRSMPEIVSWSSSEFYADAPLEPLRQFGADRLPPLRSTFVPDAGVSGTGAGLTNRAEAAALVDAVVRCAGDPAYDGASFGVVVLQGRGQVELIDGMLRGRLDAEAWESRRVRVGVAADFQGDERTVVWLSMVVAPGHRLVALAAERYRQSFNVAASRAQDQLWVFHSVAVADLTPADLRRRLLEHVTADAPLGAPAPAPSSVPVDRRHAAFGSLFAQRVFTDLTGLGFHVSPQVEIHGRCLDLVVTGGAGRVAVACDGDGEAGRPARTDAAAVREEIDREQELLRSGWSLVRVREPEYLLDPERALAGVLAELRRAGISPPARGSAPPVVVAEEADGEGEYVPRHARPDPDDAATEVLAAVIGPAPADPVGLLAGDLAGLGYPAPRRDAEVRDPHGAAVLSVAAALWPTGITRSALAAPVLLDLDPDPDGVARLRALGYQVFTAVDDLRRHVAGAGGEPADPATQATRASP